MKLEHIDATEFTINGVRFYPAGIIWECSRIPWDDEGDNNVTMLEEMVHNGTLYYEDDQVDSFDTVAAIIRDSDSTD